MPAGGNATIAASEGALTGTSSFPAKPLLLYQLLSTLCDLWPQWGCLCSSVQCHTETSLKRPVPVLGAMYLHFPVATPAGTELLAQAESHAMQMHKLLLVPELTCPALTQITVWYCIMQTWPTRTYTLS